MTRPRTDAPDGVLLLDKPQGLTSHDVVKRVKKLVRPAKVGHTGTLDPMATGLLPIALGEATKLTGWLLGGDKRYRARLELGVATDTLDATGQVVDRQPVPTLDREGIEHALVALRGPIEQIPPMFSALHHEGQRLYDLARRGVEVERKARSVVIHELSLIDSDPGGLELDVLCSSGTYVRVLANDLAIRLGTVGHLTGLVRTGASGWTLEEACPLEGLVRQELDRRLLSLEQVLERFEAIEVNDQTGMRVAQGQRLSEAELKDLGVAGVDQERVAWLRTPRKGPLTLVRLNRAGSEYGMDILRVLRPPPAGRPKKH